MRLVLIDWEDSFGCAPTWETLNSIKPETLVCRSVGWLLHDGKDCKVIVPHIAPSGASSGEAQGCGDMTIPVKAIVCIKDLPDVGAVDNPPQDVV